MKCPDEARPDVCLRVRRATGRPSKPWWPRTSTSRARSTTASTARPTSSTAGPTRRRRRRSIWQHVVVCGQKVYLTYGARTTAGKRFRNSELIMAATSAEQSHVAALRDAQALEMANQQRAELAARKARVAAHAAHVEAELGRWLLFAKCLSNDGVIALAIDDVGPSLSGLANDLLLALLRRPLHCVNKDARPNGQGRSARRL